MENREQVAVKYHDDIPTEKVVDSSNSHNNDISSSEATVSRCDILFDHYAQYGSVSKTTTCSASQTDTLSISKLQRMLSDFGLKEYGAQILAKAVNHDPKSSKDGTISRKQFKRGITWLATQYAPNLSTDKAIEQLLCAAHGGLMVFNTNTRASPVSQFSNMDQETQAMLDMFSHRIATSPRPLHSLRRLLRKRIQSNHDAVEGNNITALISGTSSVSGEERVEEKAVVEHVDHNPIDIGAQLITKVDHPPRTSPWENISEKVNSPSVGSQIMTSKLGSVVSSVVLSNNPTAVNDLCEMKPSTPSGPCSGTKAITPTSRQFNGMKAITPTSGQFNGMKAITPTSGHFNAKKAITPTSGQFNGMKAITPTSGQFNAMKAITPTSGQFNAMKAITINSEQFNGMKPIATYSEQFNGMKAIATNSGQYNGKQRKEIIDKHMNYSSEFEYKMQETVSNTRNGGITSGPCTSQKLGNQFLNTKEKWNKNDNTPNERRESITSDSDGKQSHRTEQALKKYTFEEVESLDLNSGISTQPVKKATNIATVSTAGSSSSPISVTRPSGTASNLGLRAINSIPLKSSRSWTGANASDVFGIASENSSETSGHRTVLDGGCDVSSVSSFVANMEYGRHQDVLTELATPQKRLNANTKTTPSHFPKHARSWDLATNHLPLKRSASIGNNSLERMLSRNKERSSREPTQEFENLRRPSNGQQRQMMNSAHIATDAGSPTKSIPPSARKRATSSKSNQTKNLGVFTVENWCKLWSRVVNHQRSSSYSPAYAGTQDPLNQVFSLYAFHWHAVQSGSVLSNTSSNRTCHHNLWENGSSIRDELAVRESIRRGSIGHCDSANRAAGKTAGKSCRVHWERHVCSRWLLRLLRELRLVAPTSENAAKVTRAAKLAFEIAQGRMRHLRKCASRGAQDFCAETQSLGPVATWTCVALVAVELHGCVRLDDALPTVVQSCRKLLDRIASALEPAPAGPVSALLPPLLKSNLHSLHVVFRYYADEYSNTLGAALVSSWMSVEKLSRCFVDFGLSPELVTLAKLRSVVDEWERNMQRSQNGEKESFKKRIRFPMFLASILRTASLVKEVERRHSKGAAARPPMDPLESVLRRMNRSAGRRKVLRDVEFVMTPSKCAGQVLHKTLKLQFTSDEPQTSDDEPETKGNVPDGSPIRALTPAVVRRV